MTQLHEIIEVPAPLEQAFRYTADFTHIEQWDPGVTESRKLSFGPLGLGSRFRVVIRSGFSRTPMEYEVTAFEPPHRVVLEGEGGCSARCPLKDLRRRTPSYVTFPIG